MIKFIASDIDGTLLKGDHTELDPEIFDLIRKLKAKGIGFAAASGRQYQSLHRLFAPVSEEISYIAENGALCLHQEQILSRGTIDRELGLRIFAAVRSYGDCTCMLSGPTSIYVESKDPNFVAHLRNELKYEVQVVDCLDEVKVDFLKIALFNPHGTAAMNAHFTPLFAGEIKTATAGDMWMDFISPEANKGTALANLLKHLHLTPEECVVFGDQYNDVEMLKFAGTSYAMDTAAPGVAQYADQITTSVPQILKEILAQC